MKDFKGMDALKLIGCLALCQLAGFLGSLATIPSIPTWYAQLNKPSFSPPNWVFSPVWISLFVLMGISLFIIWEKKPKNPEVRKGLIFFFVQLGLNIVWSEAFFGFHSPLAGLIVIAFLWTTILLTIQKFYKVSKIAGLLLLPYILWVSFAAILNFFLWTLNTSLNL